MNLEQEHHVGNLLTAFKILADQKYRDGAKRHKGDLHRKNVLELLLEIRDEAIDTFIYTQTAIQIVLEGRETYEQRRAGKRQKHTGPLRGPSARRTSGKSKHAGKSKPDSDFGLAVC